MNWLQTFAFVALAGFHGAYSGHHHVLRQSSPAIAVFNSFQNSFPYKQNFFVSIPDRDVHASSIVSQSAGPLCSGFHIQANVVVTAASCVFRKEPADLLVISNTYSNVTILTDGGLEFLRVYDIKINEKYNPSTNEYNMAILWVNIPENDVPILLLPRQTLLGNEQSSETYFVKFIYNDERRHFYSVKVPAEVKINLNDCINKNLDVPPNVFLCVSRLDSKPYSFGLRDLGTPLVYKSNNKFYFLGMYTGHTYHSDRTNYLYLDASGNLGFINSFNDPVENPKNY